MGSPREKFGGAKTTGGGLGYENLNVGDDKNPTPPVRIFPAVHSLAAENIWAVYHKIHFGYAGVNFRDKTKTSQKPFACVEEVNRRTDMVEVSCAECRNIETHAKMESDREAVERATLKARGILNEKEIDANLAMDPFLKSEAAWKKAHNLDKKWYLNVMTLDGKFAVLRIPHKSKQALDLRIAEVRAMGVEPISNFDQGVYFKFKRSGMGRDTLHTVEVYYEQGERPGQMNLKMAPLSDDTLEKALKILPDLNTVVRKITTQQIKLLVESSGEPEEIDVIFNMTQARGERSPQRRDVEVPASLGAGTLPSVPAPAPAAAAPDPAPPRPPLPPPPPAESSVDMEARIRAEVNARVEAEIRARFEAEVRAKMAAATPFVSAPVVPAPVAPAPAQGMTMDPMDPNIPPEQFAALFPKLPPR